MIARPAAPPMTVSRVPVSMLVSDMPTPAAAPTTTEATPNPIADILFMLVPPGIPRETSPDGRVRPSVGSAGSSVPVDRAGDVGEVVGPRIIGRGLHQRLPAGNVAQRIERA